MIIMEIKSIMSQNDVIDYKNRHYNNRDNRSLLLSLLFINYLKLLIILFNTV